LIPEKLTGTITSALIFLFTGMPVVLADDTEIFTAGTPPPPESTNVVFLIDTSGSMASNVQGDANGISKIRSVQQVFENLIFDFENTGNHNSVNPAMEGRKIALMRFDDGDSNGGYFLTRMRTLNNGSKDDFWTQIQQLEQYDEAGNRISPNGFTPLAESAYEAARFFRGESPVFGNRLPPTPDSNNRTSPGINDPGVVDGSGNYKSPFANANNISQCGVNNHLVILTDGMPTQDGSADTAINALDNTTAECVFSDSNNTDCLPQVAQHLYTTDLFADIPGEQKVMTHTIAFDLRDNTDGNIAALELLSRTAELGGGIAARADNATQLAEAIQSILREIQDTSVSFVNPAVSVSSSNRFVHDNTVYFGLFKPEIAPLWPGNLKGYQYGADGELYDFSTTPQLAIVNGSFSPTARSKWRAIGNPADGANIELGGAAEQILGQASRNIFTQNSASPSSSTLVQFSVANETNIPAADFGDNISNDLKIELIQWATSRDTNPIGDPLHSTPQIVNFGGDIGPVIFFGTNQGFIHAISASSGQELMAFIPKSLLSNLRTFKDNNSQHSHPYGLDGHISLHITDANGDGEISAVDNDRVLVIVGMRRGGNEYFALNVTDPDNPTLQWTIKGGTGDFADMGDSWSKPILTKMKFGASDTPTRKNVVLISGGYDNQYDELDNTISDPSGAALYAVDLDNGNCLWSASDSDSSGCDSHTTIPGMTNAIPSHISAIDLTSDSIVDRLYAIDILGKVFRVDLNTLNEQSNYAPSGQLFANLSGATRRFYYGIDVAYTNTGFAPKLHLSVGSGHRAHPLAEAANDIIFSFWDRNVLNPLPDGFSALTLASLTDLTSLETELPSNTEGWYFNLPAGEKVLSLASSLAGYVFFTSYTPPDGTASTTCEVQYGSGNVYAVSLANASPLDNDRAIAINSTGIPSSVAFMTLYQPDGGNQVDPANPLASQDTEVFAMVNGTKINLTDEAHNRINSSTEATKTYWYLGPPQTPPVEEEPVEE
jgi:type IV pilus assembly protein PilY1